MSQRAAISASRFFHRVRFFFYVSATVDGGVARLRQRPLWAGERTTRSHRHADATGRRQRHRRDRRRRRRRRRRAEFRRRPPGGAGDRAEDRTRDGGGATQRDNGASVCFVDEAYFDDEI